MTPGEAGRVLAKAAAFDQRTVGHADALAWAEALDGIDHADALAAVTGHYRVSTSRIMPADVRRLANEERLRTQNDRIATSPTCEHGVVGGEILRLCALCRRESVQAEPSTSRRETP